MSARRPQRGLTLIELMVAVTIGMFLLIGLLSLTSGSMTSRMELSKTATQVESGRYALTLLGEEIQAAGFNGAGTRDTYTQVAPMACPGAATQLGYIPQPYAAGIPSSVPLSVYAPAAAPTCLDHYKAGTAYLVVSRLSTVNPAPTAASVSTDTANAYLQVSTCATDTQPFVIDNGGGAFTLLQKDCATPAPVRKVLYHVYYVSTCDDCSAGAADSTPTLKVAEYVNGAMTVTPLAEGIEDLQFDFGVDYNDPALGLVGTGNPSCYTSNPANPPAAETALCPASVPPYGWASSALANWSNVVTVRIYLRARSIETSAGWADTRTYAMGLAEGAQGPFNDAYKRHEYSAVARLYNLAGQRE
ncbi:MAG: PilW family protein [Burkholderiales bacterium]|nr:PilW family protein [Burkholderiales bacterium]MDE2394351.1 PilW family protein [Burkholderiales bacterium]MDE2452888.1 PilW family protein [Burkholderiales bacterium]